MTTVRPSASTTPTDDAFYLPPDTCRHARVWLPWPAAAQTDLRVSIATFARQIAEFEPVVLVTAPADEASARDGCGDVGEAIALPHASLRLRDTGPSFLVDGKGSAAAVDWRFNMWGGRAAHLHEDETFAHALLGTAEVRRFRGPLTLEPSAIVGDGADTLIALAPAVFDAGRNPRLTRLEAFAHFRHWLGINRVIWLEDAHPADRLITDIRALTAFVRPGTVMITEPAPHHPHAEVLAGVESALVQTRAANGANLELVKLPAPRAASVINIQGGAPLSYTTFFAANGAVFMPGFDEPSDADAADILARLFPDRIVKTVPALSLAEAGVTLASLALPQPARLLERDRATVLPRSAWSRPAIDVDTLLQKYIDLAEKS